MNWIKTVLTGLTIGFLLNMALPLPALAQPRFDINGEWQGDDKMTYQVEVQGNEIRIKKPLNGTYHKLYKGPFVPGREVTVLFIPEHINHIANVIPARVREQILQKGHVFEGRVTVESPSRIILIEYVDDATYQHNELQAIHKRVEDRKIVLSRPGAYTISKVDVDYKIFQRDMAKQIAYLQGIADKMAQQDLPWREEMVNEAKTLYDHKQAQYDKLVSEGKAVSDQIKDLLKQIKTLPQERSPEFAALDDKRQTIENSIRQLEEAVLDDTKSADPAFDKVKAFKALDALKKDLAAVKEQINKQYADEKGVAAIADIRKKIRDLKEEEKRITAYQEPLADPLKEAKEHMFSLKKDFEEKKQEYRSLLRQIDFLHRKPVVMELTLKAKNQPRFVAKLNKDEELLNAIKEEMKTLDELMAKTKQDIEDTQKLEDEAKAAKDEALDIFVHAGHSVSAVGDRLYNEIIENSYWRAGAEVATITMEIVEGAARGGGLPGALKAAAEKAIEHYTGLDEVGFDAFDESNLRKQIYQTQEPLEYDGFWTNQQIAKVGIHTVKESALHALELRNALNDYHSRRSGLMIAEEHGKELSDHLQKASENKNKAVRALDEASENLDQFRDFRKKEQFKEAYKDYQSALQKRKDAINHFKDVSAEHNAAKRARWKAQKNLEKSNKNVKKLTSAKNVATSIGKDIGIGLMIDMVKDQINANLDSYEEELWREFFNKEIVAKVAHAQWQQASNYYWNIYDRKKQMQEVNEALQALRQQAEYDLQTYLNTQKFGGYYVIQNDPFGPKDEQLELEVTVLGPSPTEAVYLESPDPKSNLRVIPGLIVKPTENAAGGGENIQHRYTFDATKLSQLKEDGGELPLLVWPMIPPPPRQD